MRLGALVHLTYRERQHPVRVVGLVEEISQTTLLAPEATFEAVTGLGDAASSLRVEARDGVSLALLARALDRVPSRRDARRWAIVALGAIADAA